MTSTPIESQSPKSDGKADPQAVEDATTTAARKELKHTTLSESGQKTPDSTGSSPSASDSSAPKDDKAEDLREKIVSPKKKRAHDQTLDTPDKVAASNAGPEKKRARDEDHKPSDELSDKSADEITPPETKPPAVTSASAFAKSGFASRAASTVSPFGSGASTGSSVFGGSAAKTSPFGSAVTSTTPKLSFGSAAGSSPFGSAAGSTSDNTPKPFGSALGGSTSVFGSASKGFGGIGSFGSGAKLTSFASSGAAATFGTKSAKPFGAPESDIESGDDEADSDDDKDEKDEDEDKEDKADKTEKSEKEKKVKLHKVEVNDGESGEATLISVRTRLYLLDKDIGWKERGAGNIKINVPEAAVEFDQTGGLISGSFDPSSLSEAEYGSASKGARIIMRQDQTGRVLLNTVLVPAMKFQLKDGLKSTGIIFNAFEDGKPVNVHLKMTAINAKNWMNEVAIVQRELSGVWKSPDRSAYHGPLPTSTFSGTSHPANSAATTTVAASHIPEPPLGSSATPDIHNATHAEDDADEASDDESQDESEQYQDDDEEEHTDEESLVRD